MQIACMQLDKTFVGSFYMLRYDDKRMHGNAGGIEGLYNNFKATHQKVGIYRHVKHGETCEIHGNHIVTYM